MDDADDVLEYANDPDWVRYLINIPHPFMAKDAEAFVTRFSNPATWETLPMFAIVLAGKVIGEVYLNGLDIQNARAELGYALSRNYWGKGLTFEAASMVIDWAFRTYDLNKIFATCDPRNKRSLRVLEKLGMVSEGLLRSHLKWADQFRDVLYFGILRCKWQALPVD